MAMMNPVRQQANTLDGGIHDYLSIDNFYKLESLMNPIKETAGSYLFWEGDKSTKLYFVRSGQIKLLKATEEGKELILSIVKKGELFGEYGGNGETYHSYSAEILEDVELGVIQLKDLQQLMCQFGTFSMEFMNWLSVNYQKNQTKFRDLLLFGKKGALASTLIRMSNTYGVLRADGIKLDVKLTNTEIGDFIGMTRESVNRFLNQWKEEGTIAFDRGHIVIRRLSDLQCVCKCPTFAPCSKDICRI